VTWPGENGPQGLRYGENPDQEAAMYRLIGGQLQVGETKLIGPGLGLVCNSKLIQSGKHPGKINMTDVDAALLILRYLTDQPACAIMKHNNPCGVAQAGTISEAFSKALAADSVAAFGGAVVLGRACDRETAELVSNSYVEVVVAPCYEEGAVEILSGRKNLRIMEVPMMHRLAEFADLQFLELKSLLDGGVAAQTSFVCKPRTPKDLYLAEAKGVKINRQPTEAELKDLLFGWFVESGVTSNSVLYVKDQATVAIGTGEQDRVGVARIARDKAYRNTLERLTTTVYGKSYSNIQHSLQLEMERRTKECNGGLLGAVMISDAFFPFPDGVEVGLREGVTAVAQPGGSVNDAEVIKTCNNTDATMVFTGQRAFKH
jgi:phosphoribosylaminoimidazolecarboxamide formyltransferase/IMP cyclohydrolase